MWGGNEFSGGFLFYIFVPLARGQKCEHFMLEVSGIFKDGALLLTTRKV